MLLTLLGLASSFSLKALDGILGHKRKLAETQVGMAQETTKREIAELETQRDIMVSNKELRMKEADFWELRFPKALVGFFVAMYICLLGTHQALGGLLGWQFTIHTVPLWDYVVGAQVTYWFGVLGIKTWKGRN